MDQVKNLLLIFVKKIDDINQVLLDCKNDLKNASKMPDSGFCKSISNCVPLLENKKIAVFETMAEFFPESQQHLFLAFMQKNDSLFEAITDCQQSISYANHLSVLNIVDMLARSLELLKEKKADLVDEVATELTIPDEKIKSASDFIHMHMN